MNHMIVNAGKFEPEGDKNYKVCSEPFTNWDALVAYIRNEGLEGYPFCEIDFHVDGFVTTIDFYTFMRPQNYRG